jgi:hypothetical protein
VAADPFPKSLVDARSADGADYLAARSELARVDSAVLRQLAEQTDVTGTLAGVALLVKERPARYQQLTEAVARVVAQQSQRRNPAVLRAVAPDLVDGDAQLVLLEIALKDEGAGASLLVPRASDARVSRDLACDLLLRFADDRTVRGLIEVIRKDSVSAADDLLTRIASGRVLELFDAAIRSETDTDARGRLQAARDRVASALDVLGRG